jgi:sec-independent protein translocase protein TatC
MFVAAAILTPPDIFTQVLMAGPLLVLYEVSIGTSKLALRRRKIRETAHES